MNTLGCTVLAIGSAGSLWTSAEDISSRTFSASPFPTGIRWIGTRSCAYLATYGSRSQVGWIVAIVAGACVVQPTIECAGGVLRTGVGGIAQAEIRISLNGNGGCVRSQGLTCRTRGNRRVHCTLHLGDSWCRDRSTGSIRG